MSQAQAGTAPANTLGTALIRGRIKAVRESGGQRSGFFTVLTLPAPDEFTSPATVEVYSTERLGAVDATWAGKVQIGGFARTWNREVEDPRSGEVRKRPIPTADNTLTAIL